MKQYILSLVLLLSIISCSKKQVQVPKVALQGEEEVQNHSIIWLFYGENGTLDLNEKNRISSTHWFYNVDKKLALKEILPEIIRLRDKHNTKSPHNTEPMNNYYSYINKANDHLSFYSFDSIQYKFIAGESPKYGKDTLLLEITSLPFIIPNAINKKIQVAFSNNLNFQQYMEAKGQLENTNISSIELIIE